MRLSILDTSPAGAGCSEADAVRSTVRQARLADELGYHRYWLAEHHNLPGAAGTCPEILVGAVAAATRRIRVGAGGVMITNHSPLKVAETFRTLAALHPGRIDLGVGRAPGADPLTALALRRVPREPGSVGFDELVEELVGYQDGFAEGHALRDVRANPSDAPLPPVWILGAGLTSAAVAAGRGLGFAYAGHVPPGDPAAPARYRVDFRPGGRPAPYLVLTAAVVCADTEAAARRSCRALELSLVRLHDGRVQPHPTAEEAARHRWTDQEEASAAAVRQLIVAGTPEQVRSRLRERAARWGADELMITTDLADETARRRSYELTSEAVLELPVTA